MSKKIDEIKDIVNEYVQQEKIALFVGAGISALSGYPSWSKLVLNMAKKIGYQVKLKDLDGNECLSSDEYLKIPQIFYENKGEKEYFKIVRKKAFQQSITILFYVVLSDFLALVFALMSIRCSYKTI